MKKVRLVGVLVIFLKHIQCRISAPVGDKTRVALFLCGNGTTCSDEFMDGTEGRV